MFSRIYKRTIVQGCEFLFYSKTKDVKTNDAYTPHTTLMARYFYRAVFFFS